MSLASSSPRGTLCSVDTIDLEKAGVALDKGPKNSSKSKTNTKTKSVKAWFDRHKRTSSVLLFCLLGVGIMLFVLSFLLLFKIGRGLADENETVKAVDKSSDLTQYVNVFTGTEGGGNDNPAAARPFGMVKLGPDLLDSKTDAYSGYLPTGDFSGFSMMHEQGTGGAPKYGTVSQLPLVGEVPQPLSNITVGRTGADEGSVGYYKAVTSESVTVELSPANRAGIYRYTFPKTGANNILVDVSHVLPSFRGQGLGQGYAGGDITVFADGHYEGHGVYNNGWNRSPNWPIYFCKCTDLEAEYSLTYET
jgi:putative alpha-1,2-mannosidase